MHGRAVTTRTPDIDLPPLFRLVTLREIGDAYAYATANASKEGAGTLVHVGRFDLVEFALVLEPEEPLRVSRCAFYACMVALRAALLAHAPPERPITFTWPDAIHVDGGLVGGGRFGWPADAVEDEPPEWLVFGASIRTVAMSAKEAGLRPLTAALVEEGFDDTDSNLIVASFARYLMANLDAWRTNEFATVTAAYLDGLTTEKGVIARLDAEGNLLTRFRGQTEPRRHDLVSALATPSWLDPATGGPRL